MISYTAVGDCMLSLQVRRGAKLDSGYTPDGDYFRLNKQYLKRNFVLGIACGDF